MENNGIQPDKQARKVVIPVRPIVEMLARAGLKNVVLRQVRGDLRQEIFILHVDADAAEDPETFYEFAYDWKALFDSLHKQE